MAEDFDQFPVYDVLIKPENGKMSDEWIGSFSTLYQTLIGYLTQFGIFLPNLTSVQRNSIINPQNGQIIYNTTIDAPQFYQVSSSSWRTISFT